MPPCPALDPEGLFATAGAACSAFVGLLYGFLLLQVWVACKGAEKLSASESLTCQACAYHVPRQAS